MGKLSGFSECRVIRLNCNTNKEESAWKKKSPRPLLLLNAPFTFIFLLPFCLIFSSLHHVSSLFRCHCNGLYQNMYVCSALALVSNIEHKICYGKKEAFQPLAASFLSLSRQQAGFSWLKYQHTKKKEAVLVCPAIISSSSHAVTCSVLGFDVYNEPTRETSQVVCAALGVVLQGRQLRSNQHSCSRQNKSCIILHHDFCQVWQITHCFSVFFKTGANVNDSQ